MTIEVRERPNEKSNARSVVTNECSFCGEQIKEQQSIGDHLRNECDGI